MSHNRDSSVFPRVLSSCLCAFVLMIPAGCSSDPRRGYSFASTYPAGVKSVRVPVFENNTYEIGLESQVTEAVIKEMQRSSGLKVVQAADADSTLRAVITRAEMRRLSTGRGVGLVQELGVIVSVDFEWVDNRSGKVLLSRRGFAAADNFVPARPTGERLETGQRGAVQRLARDLVSELRMAW